MKRKIITIFTVAAVFLSTFVVAMPISLSADSGTTYYVDSVSGNDGNNGISESAAWKSIVKVDWGGLQPGDKVLLKKDSYFTGSITINRLNGTRDKPIIIGTYGEGAKPIIQGGADGVWAQHAIKIENSSYITVDGIHAQVYNPGNFEDYLPSNPSGQKYVRRSGIWIVANPWGGVGNINVRGVTIRNCEISKVTGVSINENFGFVGDGINSTAGDWITQSLNAGIMINQWSTDSEDGYISDLIIENNYIHDITTVGISSDGDWQKPSATNIIIRNNVVTDLGCDGIVIGPSIDPLIENNVVYNAGGHMDVKDFYWIAGLWVWGTTGATIQNNEVAYTRSMPTKNDSDAAAFDTDICTRGNHYWQYNYSHDNEGGFYMSMGELGMGDVTNSTTFVRYNISVNDMRQSNFDAQLVLRDVSQFTNNVIYNDLDSQNTFKMRISGGKYDSVPRNPNLINNVFYFVNGGELNDSGRYFNNAFYGITPPADAVDSVVSESGTDLGFVNIGNAGDGLTVSNGVANWDRTVTDRYKLMADSKLIGAGKFVPENFDPEHNGARDYFGNTLYVGMPDIGVYEDPNSDIADETPPATPTALTCTSKTDSTLELTWNAKEDGKALDARLYNAKTNKIIAYITGANTYTVKDLDPDTEYSFYVIAIDNAGNVSEKSEVLTIKTVYSAVIVDNDSSVTSGTWNSVSGWGSYNDNFATSKDPDATMTWTPDLPTTGYYGVYYWLPKGNQLKTGNAQFTVNYANGSVSYGLNQRKNGGQWVLLGTHYFEKDGTSSVVLSNNGGKELNGDAVRFMYIGDTIDIVIETVTMKAANTTLAVGESTVVNLVGADSLGRLFNMNSLQGAEITYLIGNDSVISVKNGMITALAEGTSTLTIEVKYNGETYHSGITSIFVGNTLTVAAPIAFDRDGNVIDTPSSVPPTSVRVDVSNMSEKAKQVMVIATVTTLDSKTMITYANSNAMVIQPADSNEIILKLDVSPDIKVGKVNIFIWDSMEGMHPVAEPMIL